MRDSDMRKKIAGLHEEVNGLLQKGDRESIVQICKTLGSVWPVLLNKDSGLKYLSMFLNIWNEETVRAERTILWDVKSVDQAVQKYRNIRFALWRLENDLPVEICLEGMRSIIDMRLSNTAFQYLLPLVVEDSDKVLAKINEINKEYS